MNQGIRESLDYEKFCLMSIVYHSTKIEGCSLTETDTQVLLENNITASGKPLTDHLMVTDHYQAFRVAKQFAIEKRKMSVNLIKEINALNETEEKQDLNIFRNFICHQQSKFCEAEIRKIDNLHSGFSLLF